MEKCSIGENAGKIWKSLNELENITIGELARKLDISVEHAAMAAGWLARENQITINRKNGMITLSSKKSSVAFQFG